MKGKKKICKLYNTPMNTNDIRFISEQIEGVQTNDGAGVALTRLIGQGTLDSLDPFLLFDNFHSNNKQDYIAGFPAHPHRGFETVTYLLSGKMRHKDNKGHEGLIEPGGIQWMTAGRGIIHSEMPEQEKGLLQGFQLWINLPSQHKMATPAYQEYNTAQIPKQINTDGSVVKIIAGKLSSGLEGPVRQPLTNPTYIDIFLPPDCEFYEPITENHNAFVYIIQGSLEVMNRESKPEEIEEGVIGVLSKGRAVRFKAKNQATHFLLIAGCPIEEPIVRHGPFVMNTIEEIKKAVDDYTKGLF